MKLIQGWRAALNRLWTVRVAIFAALLPIADQILAQFERYIPAWIYSLLFIAIIVLRVIQQPDPEATIPGKWIPDQHKKKAAWVAMCVACVSGFEGLRQVAYNDPVGIPTICFGETKGVKLGDRATLDQCKAMLADSLEDAAIAVDRCTHVPLPDTRRAALVSFTYNVGGGAYCGSTVARKLNAGDVQGGCDALLMWRKAQGITLPGLLNRREKERQMCLA